MICVWRRVKEGVYNEYTIPAQKIKDYRLKSRKRKTATPISSPIQTNQTKELFCHQQIIIQARYWVKIDKRKSYPKS